MALREGAEAAVLDLKSQLKYLKLDYGSPVLDAGVAGYLLNPLKDTYDYDDLARDYLDMTVPSKADLLGKEALAAALDGRRKRQRSVPAIWVISPGRQCRC